MQESKEGQGMNVRRNLRNEMNVSLVRAFPNPVTTVTRLNVLGAQLLKCERSFLEVLMSFKFTHLNGIMGKTSAKRRGRPT